jgi:predicted small secreted protein
MNKLRVLLVAAALLTAACGTATISGSQVKSISSSGSIRVDAGANAGTTVAGANDDLGRPNPPVHRGGTVPVTQAQSPTTNATTPSAIGHDRCTDGFPASDGAGTRNGAPGKRLPLPMCAVQ